MTQHYATTTQLESAPALATCRRLRPLALAVSLVGGPLAFTIGGLLSPTVQFDGVTLIAATPRPTRRSTSPTCSRSSSLRSCCR